MSAILILLFPIMAGIISSLLISYIGVYVVLRRNVFIGLALPQIAGLGIAAGFLLGKSPLFFSILFILIGVFYFTFSHQNEKIPGEAIIGFSYVFTAALSILFIAHSPKGKDEIINLLFGNILIVGLNDIILLSILAIIILFILIKLNKYFLIVSYDREIAKIQHISPNLWNFLFYLLLGISISITIKIIGSLLVFAFLIIPAMVGLLFTKNMKTLFIYSISFGLISSIIGILLSFYFDMPTGPFIISLMGTFYLLLYVFHYLTGK